MAQGRSTKIISTIKWIRTRRLSIKKSLSVGRETHLRFEACDLGVERLDLCRFYGQIGR